MKALLIALVAGAALFGGYHYLAGEREQARLQGYRAAEAVLKKEHAEALLMQAQSAEVERQRLERRATHIEANHLSKRTELEANINKLEDALDEAYTDHYRPTPAAQPQPVPECVFTVGWLRDYNAAFGGVQATAARAGQPDAEPWPTPGADAEYSNSQVSQRDLLRHAQRYGQWCQRNTHQLKSLIETVSTQGDQP
ncbi:lysis protein [Marinobacter sp.]|uniref:lysis protein n=1 Tax=Marinobacter sp. TaxID=50741 RepID=UPI0034A27787